uniref:Uncharacterized protein n=1 Tax=Brassica oleracea TaxID=3712 RepID=A0A3P6BYB7_BRAOL|nr:unnamed protein product [Brassica oleracea]
MVSRCSASAQIWYASFWFGDQWFGQEWKPFRSLLSGYEVSGSWALSCVWRAMCSNGKPRSLACAYF